jgi:hypothetical protein
MLPRSNAAANYCTKFRLPSFCWSAPLTLECTSLQYATHTKGIAMDAPDSMLPRKSRFGAHQLFFVVDAEFAEQVSRMRWSKTAYGYLESICPETKKRLWLHRYVWTLAHGWHSPILDHISGVRWDCRLSNLRPATRSLNSRNRRVRRKYSLPRGVGLRTGSARTGPKPYYARIRIGGKQIVLGYFRSPEEAGAAYKSAYDSVSSLESAIAAKECVNV